MTFDRNWLTDLAGGSDEHLGDLREQLLQARDRRAVPFHARAVTVQQPPPAVSDSAYGLALSALDKVLDNGALTEEEAQSLEAVVVPYSRPALLVTGDTFAKPALSVFSPVWERRESLVPLLRATGRINTPGHPYTPFCGTGVVTSPGVIMTNRHVVQRGFGRWDGTRWRIDESLSPTIDFNACGAGSSPREVPIVDVLFVHPELDMAFARLEESDDVPAPVRIAPELPQDERPLCVVVGHPAMDSRCPLDLQILVFESVFNVKRVAPGFMTRTEGENSLLHHDCSTLGGNSGSGVFVLTAHACGLHFRGEYLKTNVAVSLPPLRDHPDLAHWLHG